MDTLECIKSRRSIRRFTEEKVSDEILYELLEAVRWSPSWSNTQCWEVVVVRDSDNKLALLENINQGNPAAKGIMQAPVVMIFCARRGISGGKKGIASTSHGDWYMFDLGIACQNFCLAAHSRGLGTVHVGSFNHRGVDKALNLPDGIESVEIIPLGYPVRPGVTPPRKEIDEFVHYEKYHSEVE